MASLSSSTNIGASSASSIRGYGGLVSGLDRDSLIEGMTAATKSKIAKQQQKRQTYLWQQEAYRSVSSKLVEFSKKYTSYTSSTNLASASFWSSSSIITSGTYSKYVTATGSSSSASSMSILGVEQLAQSASMTSKGTVSDGKLSTGELNLIDGQTVSNLEGQKIDIKFGNTTYTVSLGTGDYSTGEKAAASFNAALQNIDIGSGKTLADVIKVTSIPEDSTSGDFQLNMVSTDTGNNTIQITGGTSTALTALGLSDASDLDKTMTDSGFSQTVLNKQDFFAEDQSFASIVGGKKISFTYNGTTKSITLPDADKLSGYTSNAEALAALQTELSTQLKTAFGSGRISVGINGNKLTFETTLPNGTADTSSVLSIASADTGVLSALKTVGGESNRLNLSSSLVNSGIAALSGKTEAPYFYGSTKALAAIEALGSVSDDTSIDDLKALIMVNDPNMSSKDLSSINNALDYFASDGGTVGELKVSMNSYVANNELSLTVNGTKITGLSYSSTMTEVMNAVNASDAGVTISYIPSSDKFSIVSKEAGASGSTITLGDADDPNDITSLMFGTESQYNVQEGKDAVVWVKDSSGQAVKMERGSNTFYLDGLNITVSGTFGCEQKKDVDGNPIEGEYELINGSDPVTFTSKIDTDKIVSAVSSMVTDYNAILDLVNSLVSTKPDRDYSPLTDAQKEDMTEDQIEKWEAKAKEGILFSDTDLRSLSDSMRFIFESGSVDKTALESFGISTSSTYSDNGKLEFDEKKFRAALESDPDAVKNLFVRTSDTSTGDKGGVMARLTTITEKYASTTGATKGILIQKAGSTYAPTSVLSNSLQKSIDSIDDYIERLNDQLETETDRYIKQFTNLETLISQMNSQSSYLSSLSS